MYGTGSKPSLNPPRRMHFLLCGVDADDDDDGVDDADGVDDVDADDAAVSLREDSKAARPRA